MMFLMEQGSSALSRCANLPHGGTEAGVAEDMIVVDP